MERFWERNSPPSLIWAIPHLSSQKFKAQTHQWSSSFYSGGAAVTFVQAYGEFGLSGSIPLVCAGFTVEEDVLPAQGEAALGAFSGLHWALLLDNPENKGLYGRLQNKNWPGCQCVCPARL